MKGLNQVRQNQTKFQCHWEVLDVNDDSNMIMFQVSLGMMRSDLMLDKDSFCCCWKQVELNTIASGFGWMGPASGMIHRSVKNCLTPALKWQISKVGCMMLPLIILNLNLTSADLEN